MNKPLKILLLVLLAVVVVQSIAVAVLYRRNAQLIKYPPITYRVDMPFFDRTAVSPQASAEFFSAVISDKMTFDNQTLLECLQKLDRSAGQLGFGHIQIRGAGSSPPPDQRISLKFEKTTFREILKALEEASGAKIEITKYYFISATYGKPPEAKP